MMNRIFLCMIILLSALGSFAQSDSSDLKISVLTCAHGDQIYSSFGHCAFRAKSESLHIDRVYNYGTFNYKQPYFVIKFCRGFLNYALSAYGYSRFCYEYIRDKRNVVEQELNLSPAQVQDMYKFLEWNALEENRYYKYNFLEDNCATKIRDIIRDNCGGNVAFPDTTYGFTLRDGINERIEEMPWFRMGITLLMGLPVDKKATSQTAMFLPDYVYSTLKATTIMVDGVPQPIVSRESVVIPFDTPVDRTDWLTYLSPSLLFWMIFAFWGLATFYEVKNSNYHAWADKLFFSLVGFFGFICLVMWTLTEHTVTEWNLNVLWVLPTHLVAAWTTRRRAWIPYFKVTAILTAALLVLGPVFPQHFDVAFYPVMLIIIMRAVRIGFCKMPDLR